MVTVARPHRLVLTLAWPPVIGLPLALLALWAIVGGDQDTLVWVLPLFTGVVATFGAVGALILTRRPGNAVGWILWAVGITMGLSLACQSYAGWSVISADATLPGTLAAAWFASWSFSPALAMALLILPLLFPDGRLPSRRWRIVLLAFVAAVVVTMLPNLLRPGPLGEMTSLANPTGLTGHDDLLAALSSVSDATVPLGLPLALLAAVLRYRRGSPTERQQLKWFGAAAALAAALLALASTQDGLAAMVVFAASMIALGLVPVAIGIAILRHRLYEIDRIVSRTISWAIVTGLLAAVFVGIVLVLQASLAGLIQGQTLAVAASTLAAVTLFQPLRRRVQRTVDRRFDRRGYNAQQTIAAFAERLRSEVDLARLRTALIATADEAVRPMSTTVWLRDTAEGGR